MPPLTVSSLQKNIIEKGTGSFDTLESSGWNLLAEEISFPAAVINQEALLNNAKWMQTFSQRANVKLAPHGKTTMSPELFNIQQQQGCWGMSLATVPQVATAYQSGIKRIILANQLIGRRHFEIIAELLAEGDLEFYCFVDSIDNAKSLGQYFSDKNIKLNILLEIGVMGGRCGWRDTDNIMQLCDVIGQFSCLQICGISFYEGVIHGENATNDIIDFVKSITKLNQGLFDKGVFLTDEVILTGAGSAWYDLVAKHLQNNDNSFEFTAILRPGCYLIHDTGIYQDAQNAVVARSELACELVSEPTGDLISCLSVWAYVYSIPEPGLVIIGMGKRDVAFDAGFPTPELHFRPGNAAPVNANSHWKIVNIMDQHCMMKTPNDANLQPGDLICFSTSHPCLTMDKWRYIGLIDNNFISEGDINVILIADTDILADHFWIRKQDMLGVSVPQPISNNGDFVINSIENLSGSTDLISLRGRGKYSRPFEKVETIRKQAESKFREREKKLQVALEETENKIQKLQQEQGNEKSYLLNNKLTTEIEKFRNERLATRKELRSVQHDLRKNIEKLGAQLRFINIGLIPLLITLLALIIGIYRASKKV